VATAAILTVRERHARGEKLLAEAFDKILFEHASAESTRLLDDAAALGVDTSTLHLYRGLIPLLSSQPQTAVPPLLEAYKRDPQRIETLYALAGAYSMMTDETNAKPYFALAEGRDITTALGWLLRGYALSQNEGTAAIEAYNHATALRPDFTPAIEGRANYRGNRLVSLGERDQLQPMLNDYDAWVIFRPDSPRSFSARAMGWTMAAAYAGTQPDLRDNRELWLARARDDFAHARQMPGGVTTGLRVREGAMLFYSGDFRGATDAYSAVLPADVAAAARVFPAAVYHRAIALHALGELPAALADAEAAATNLPSFFPLALHRALLLAEIGRLPEARQACSVNLDGRTGVVGLITAAAELELIGDPAPGQSAAAQAALHRFEEHQRAAGWPPADQPYLPALDYLAGRIDAPAMMAAIGPVPKYRCETAVLVALREFGRGDRAAAAQALRDCLDTGVFIFAQYRLAQVLQARSQQDPAWPPWVPATAVTPTPPASPTAPASPAGR
jgi:tetratricopeptide (TPR) repeat protein